MKVAIAGTGPVAKYLIEELTTYGHDVLVLTRNPKSEQKFEQRHTDYSIASLVKVLEDRDALISTVADYVDLSNVLKVHLDMLEAVKQSTKCKTYLPSEWTANVEDYPEQPMFFEEANHILHEKLKQASGIRWTIICNSWFADYVVPQQHRLLRDVGDIWPMDYASKVFTIYGPGTQVVSFAFVRDVTKAVAALLDSKEPWEPYTFISGEQLTWNQLFDAIKKSDPQWKSRNKSLAETINQITANESPESVLTGQFEILSYSGAAAFPKEKIERQRAKYFPNVQFRTVQEVLDAAAAKPDQII